MHLGLLYTMETVTECCASPAVVCVVRAEGTPYLCQTDEVGEICVSSSSTGVAYYGLPGMTKNVFEVRSFIPPLVKQTEFYFYFYKCSHLLSH